MCTPLFVKICINYPKGIMNMKLMNFTVLYAAPVKGGKPLLREL